MLESLVPLTSSCVRGVCYPYRVVHGQPTRTGVRPWTTVNGLACSAATPLAPFKLSLGLSYPPVTVQGLFSLLHCQEITYKELYQTSSSQI